MGTRGWSPVTEEEAAKLTLAELETRLAAARWAYDSADSNQARKGCFKALTRLEGLRESLHGIPAPDRTEPARRK
jgi:hypothetical protein